MKYILNDRYVLVVLVQVSGVCNLAHGRISARQFPSWCNGGALRYSNADMTFCNFESLQKVSLPRIVFQVPTLWKLSPHPTAWFSHQTSHFDVMLGFLTVRCSIPMPLDLDASVILEKLGTKCLE